MFYAIVMADLISRAAAIDALGERPYNWTDSEAEIAEVCAWESHKSAIENINAVDAVPIIRCASCKWWDKDQTTDGVKGFCPNTGCCEKPDFYCADGERRERE